MINRVVLIILDSVGIGYLPDADEYGDKGANTLLHVAEAVGSLRLPNLERLGLGNIVAVPGIKAVERPEACFGKMQAQSAGKDTTTGHWEIAGIILEKPFPTYPNGFPKEVISEFEEEIGRQTLGNKKASGTIIIEELGKEHMRTGSPIVYTSADSVFQIAAHEEVIPIEELYKECRIARNILTGKHAVGRVIARPFAGELGSFKRTARRHDFSLKPPQKTMLDIISDAGKQVLAVGKIKDIFVGGGITDSVATSSNREGIERIKDYLDQAKQGLIFANLVDFDMLYGHRNDSQGYANALKEFDQLLPDIIAKLHEDDVLVISADHGTDPGFPGSDHTREYVPVLIAGEKIVKGKNIGVRESFSDLGATITDLLDCGPLFHGTSFASEVIE